ncbi:MAG: peptide deformylase [Cytophagales bacterium]
MILPVVAYGDPVLRKKADELNPKAEFLPKLIEDMFETMYNASGVGLAAPQVGLPYRLFVIDADAMDKENIKGMKKVFLNPLILSEEGEEWDFEEGCLSIPGIRKNVSRKAKITIEYVDCQTGKKLTETYDGLVARVIQHEYDHIEGVVFVDRLTSLQKKLLKSKLSDISKGNVSTEYRMKFPLGKGR